MIRMKPLGPGVHVADEPIVHVGRSDIGFLKEGVYDNERSRTRLCAHKENGNKLHEMFIVMGRDTYIRPSQHLNKDESLHVLEGSADFVFFDEQGRVVKIVALGDYSSGRQFYCRTPAFTFHTLVIQSELLIVHETTQGPFDRADTVFASWAPEDGDKAAVSRFMERLRAQIADVQRSSQGKL